jgi:hypothetical protein
MVCDQAVPESVVDPMKYYRNNLVGTINLIDCMDAHNCKTLGTCRWWIWIFASYRTKVMSDDLRAPRVSLAIPGPMTQVAASRAAACRRQTDVS